MNFNRVVIKVGSALVRQIKMAVVVNILARLLTLLQSAIRQIKKLFWSLLAAWLLDEILFDMVRLSPLFQLSKQWPRLGK